MVFEYPTFEECIQIHDKIIQISGGKVGEINLGELEKVLVFVQSNVYYPNFLDKASYLAYSINKNHAFMDGNKRSSIAISEMFLYKNGYEYVLPYFAKKMEDVAVGVADNIISKDELHGFIDNILNDVDFSEAQKIQLIRVKNISSL